MPCARAAELCLGLPPASSHLQLHLPTPTQLPTAPPPHPNQLHLHPDPAFSSTSVRSQTSVHAAPPAALLWAARTCWRPDATQGFDPLLQVLTDAMQRTNQAATAVAALPATLTDGAYAGAEMDRAKLARRTAPSAAPPGGTGVVTLNNNSTRRRSRRRAPMPWDPAGAEPAGERGAAARRGRPDMTSLSLYER